MAADTRWQDATDPLREFRQLFSLAGDVIYLDGNSLGLLSVPAEQAVLRMLASWKSRAIEGWTQGAEPWFTLAEQLGARIAPLVGALPGEVIVANTTTVNLHQLLATLFSPQNGRQKILVDPLCFPSDLYAIQSHLRLRGLDPDSDLVVAPCRDNLLLEEDDLIAAMTAEIALAVLPAVAYQTGQLLDIPRLTRAAHARGLLIGFDCAHSIGSVPHMLHDWNVDFAFWCHYKYLNAGPGSIGGLSLHQRHFGRAPGLAGWFSSDKDRQFDMADRLTPALHAGALQIGTPCMLSMAPLIGSLEIFEQAGLERLRRKSLDLTDCLIALTDDRLSRYGFQVVTPRARARRGGHIALSHPEARRIALALKAVGVVPDFRPPAILRLAPVALYNSFSDCRGAVDRLTQIMESRAYEEYPATRSRVT